MKIGIDVSQLAYPGTGVAVYTQNLIENLLKIDKGNEYLFFFSSMRRKPPKGWDVKNLKLPPLFLEVLWNRLHVIPIERFIGKIDIFHTSDWLEPPAKCPKVTTIHDLAIFKFPETFIPRGGHDIVSNLKRKLSLVKEESKLIIAVSENTKKDIVELLKIPENKIRVVYEAAGEIFKKQDIAEV
ncbi:MAG: glycosyltransferase, partial [bacterium]|nr:glycosyltransferase [bacterium]